MKLSEPLNMQCEAGHTRRAAMWWVISTCGCAHNDTPSRAKHPLRSLQKKMPTGKDLLALVPPDHALYLARLLEPPGCTPEIASGVHAGLCDAVSRSLCQNQKYLDDIVAILVAAAAKSIQAPAVEQMMLPPLDPEAARLPLAPAAHGISSKQSREQQLIFLGKVLRSDADSVLQAVSFTPGTMQPVTCRYIRRVGRPRKE